MPTTTADLFSIETVRDLIVNPVFQTSAVLPHLRRIDTRATTTYLPVVSGGTANWYGELTPIAEAGVTADELAVTPRAIKAIQAVSNESRMDANAAVIIGRALTDAIAREVDRTFVLGATPTGPAGLPGVTGVTDIDGPTTALGSYVDAISAIQTEGGTPTVIFISPADWAALLKLESAAGSNIPALSPDTGATEAAKAQLYGVPVVPVAALPAGTAYVVDGTRLVTVQRMPATVAVDDGSLFASDGVQVRAVMRLEWAACYPSTIAKINDIPLAEREREAEAEREAKAEAKAIKTAK